MESLLFSLLAVLILFPILFLMPIGLTKQGKISVIIGAFFIAVLGLFAANILPYFQILLIMILLISIMSYFMYKKLNKTLFLLLEDNFDDIAEGFNTLMDEERNETLPFIGRIQNNDEDEIESIDQTISFTEQSDQDFESIDFSLESLPTELSIEGLDELVLPKVEIAAQLEESESELDILIELEDAEVKDRISEISISDPIYELEELEELLSLKKEETLKNEGLPLPKLDLDDEEDDFWKKFTELEEDKKETSTTDKLEQMLQRDGLSKK